MTNDSGEEADSMLDLFFSELASQIAKLQDLLKKLEAGSANDETFETLFRLCHSVKGAARIVQYDSLYGLAQSMETLMREVDRIKQAPSKETLAVFTQGITAFEEILNIDRSTVKSYISEQEKAYKQLVVKLEKAKKRLQGEEDVIALEVEIPEGKHRFTLENISAISEEIEPEMIQLFQRESTARFDILNAGLDKLKQDLANKSELHTLIDAIHLIVESSRIVGFKGVELIGVIVEESLHRGSINENPFSIETIENIQGAITQLQSLTTIPPNKIKEWFNDNKQSLLEVANALDTLPKVDEKPAEKKPEQPKPKEVQVVVDSEIDDYELEKNAIKSLKLNFNMMDLFLTELEVQVNVLSNDLIKFEQSEGDTDLLEPLMRAAHSIKGAGKVVNLEPVVHLSHVMEDCFVAAQNREIELDELGIDLLLKGVDILDSIRKIPTENLLESLVDGYESTAKLIECISLLSKGKKYQVSTAAVTEVKTPPTTTEGKQPIVPAIEEPTPDLLEQPAKKIDATDDVKQDRVLRVTAQSLNRLMGLAGESLVESRWLQPFGDALLKLKKIQNTLSEQIDNLWETLDEKNISDKAALHMEEVKSIISEERSTLNDRLSELEMFIQRHSSLSDRLYREVIDSRMRPFKDGVEAFPRMVRDIARELGKKVRLETLGETTQVDREILEKLEAPLSHLLRNAVDHGIESIETREAAGKLPEGVVKLEAFHQAGMLAITITDDGKGIDLENLRKKIVKKRLVTEEMSLDLNETELLDFLFLPGFSTKDEVTKISGRGVGLDVVQSMVQEVGGNIQVKASPNDGTAFYLHLPLTLSVIRALLVEISGEPFAFPLARIDRALIISEEDIEIIENRQYFTFEKQNVGLVPLYQTLGMQEPSTETTTYSVVVISDRSNYYGAVVDKFLGERELVVQELDSRLGKIPDITAGALMEDGDPVLIMDVQDIVRSIDTHLSGGRLKRIKQVTGSERVGKKRILIVDDSITVREVECRLLENKGYEVETAVNGVDGWNAVRIGNYDLVITDVDMPRMNGIELTRSIKEDDRLKVIPVMIVSYKEREEDRIRGLDAGADYYLTKSSFHDETLINVVEDLIGKA